MNGSDVICLTRLLPENQGGSRHGGQCFVVGAWIPWPKICMPVFLPLPARYHPSGRFTRSIVLGDFYIMLDLDIDQAGHSR